MSAQDGGAYFPQHQDTCLGEEGASCRFELFKAILGGMYAAASDWADWHARDCMINEACSAADASLRALGLVGEQPQQNGLCPVCDLHKRNCVCAPESELASENERALRCLSMAFGNPCVDGDGADGLAGGLVEHVITKRDVLQAQFAKVEQQRDALADALRDLAERAKRARGILQKDGGNWGMLDTARARAALAAIEPEQEDAP